MPLLLSSKQASKLLPPSVARYLKPQQWVERVGEHFLKTAVQLSQSKAKKSYVSESVADMWRALEGSGFL